MAKLEIDIIPSELFSFSENTFSAEASDLYGYSLTKLIFDDAVDVGFSIKSAKTGAVEIFTVSDHAEDREGELLYWIYTPLNLDLLNKGIKVIIYND